MSVYRGFIKVSTGGQLSLTPGQRIGKALRASGGILPGKILKFYGRGDVFSCILKLQTMTFKNQKKITFLDNLIMIK